MADEREAEPRRTRLFEVAAARSIPLGTILTTVAVVVAVYLAGRLVYKLREILLLIVVAGFIALLLNPAVVGLRRLGVQRRGSAVAIVTAVFLVVFAALAFAFGYPLVNGLTHLAENLPRYVSQVEHGKGWLGHLFTKYHVKHWVQTNLAPKLAQFAKNLSKPALSVGKGRTVARHRPGHDLHPGAPAPPRGPQAAQRAPADDVARARGQHDPHRRRGQPLGHRLHGRATSSPR